ncbi:MAG: hypothetical protein Q4B57_01980 [Eubacteriales bacterium]|nr:hypothetical protein [Eubacteriales bacterium]
MRLLLAIRDHLGRFYGKYDTVIRLFCKFTLAFVTFWSINIKLGQMAFVGHPVLLLGMSVLCAFLPSNSIVMISTAMILIHFYGISLEAALAGGGLLIIGCLLYFSIAPSSSVPIVFTALGLAMGIPAAVPVMFGLIGGPLTAVGIIFGTFIYYLVDIVEFAGGTLQATAVDAAEAMVQKMTVLMNAVLQNREMLLTAVVLAVTLWIVWLVRRLAIRYAWIFAALLGCMMYALIRIGGATILGLRQDLWRLLLDIFCAMLVAASAQMLLFNLDYRGTENVRFEDDEYYYYVKAVPKRKIRRRRRVRRAERRSR